MSSTLDSGRVEPESLDDDRRNHLRMDRAEVGVRAGLGEGRLVVIAGIERGRGRELVAGADDDVRLFVAIGPGDLRADRHAHALWNKMEIADFDLVFGRTH